MNKLHRKIAQNQERWLKRLASQVQNMNHHTPDVVREWYNSFHFTAKAAAHTVLLQRRSKCQHLARYIRVSERGMRGIYGTYFTVKWPIFLWAAVDNDLDSDRCRLTTKRYLSAINTTGKYHGT